MPVQLSKTETTAMARSLKTLLANAGVYLTHQQSLNFVAKIAGWRNHETLAATQSSRRQEQLQSKSANLSAKTSIDVFAPAATRDREPTQSEFDEALVLHHRQGEILKSWLIRRAAADVVTEINRLVAILENQADKPADFDRACTIEDSDSNGTAIQNVEDSLTDWFGATPTAINLFRDSIEWSPQERPNDATRAAFACVNEAYELARSQWDSQQNA